MRQGRIRDSAPYGEIQRWVKLQYGFGPKTCWIAHCKEMFGLPVRAAWNRRRAERLESCPAEKQLAIRHAFQHFGMLS